MTFSLSNKLAFDIAAADLATAQGYTYASSVDLGAFLPLVNPVVTESGVAGVFTVTSDRPAMNFGAHSLIVQATATVNGVVYAGTPSASLNVTLVAPTPAQPVNLRAV